MSNWYLGGVSSVTVIVLGMEGSFADDEAMYMDRYEGCVSRHGSDEKGLSNYFRRLSIFGSMNGQ